MMESKKILLVEDDKNLGFVIKDNLSVNGYEVTLCEDGLSGLEIFEAEVFDLCILDIMLPYLDGFNLAKSIRKCDKEIPILFLSAKSLQEDKIEGFKIGADDYITKPFSMEELLLRIEVFLKRTKKEQESNEPISIGKFSFHPQELFIELEGEKKGLTRKESDLLRYLCKHKNVVRKREEILIDLWGDDDYFKGRSLDVFISKLRKYLKEDDHVDIINFHGVGFKLDVK